MGHKRAKKSVRDADRAAKGFNHAPSASTRDDTPKGAMRIFNAAKVQAAFRARGGTNSEDTGERGPKRKRDAGGNDEPAAPKPKAKKADLPKIGEHESLGEYNRRVEATLRGGVSSAIKAAASAKGQAVRDFKAAKKARKEAAQGKTAHEDEEQELKPNRPAKEFEEAPQRKRLNDVAQAPPALPRMRAAVKAGAGAGGSAWAAAGGSRTPLNAGQKRLMEVERERVIAQYREIKARKEADKEAERAAAAAPKKGGKSK
ncbi:uncharacterized protein LOC62_02G002404 [Vanrija pseudolonga]|uniref:Uncharacterized protein n=1 Tax=Vanrija pseudolonga TaxID=143232 RepID=A0AAF1BGI8_9TREE|nr:hypothetical protein LOC62_02G002404 [Vanrija pseudolonga]